MENLENYFEQFRKNIVGIDATFQTPYGQQKLIYADWIASGRLYGPIEDIIKNTIGPMVGNTHSESSETGIAMTQAYHMAHKIIKEHVNACCDDVILTVGSGMTGVVSKLQRILGLKIPEKTHSFCHISANKILGCLREMGEERPVVFITHMEHHSNHTSWLETIAEVVIIEPDENLLVNPDNLREQIKPYKDRKLKIGAFSACSNVTGIKPPYYELAKIMHENGGYAFIDFAASAPYLKIDMHPEDPMEKLDAIFFSPHKFLGGPGSSGVVVFNKELYQNLTPDQPGGGTVTWTNRWGEYQYIDDIETREDGGTPAFLQAMRAALCIQLKEKMGCENIYKREEELLRKAFSELRKIPGLNILADNVEDRIGVISFYIKDIHHNLIVKLLNDRFGVQVRGGCSCAGTYGHYLLKVDRDVSKRITEKINKGDLSEKPGWVRLSLHPTMTNEELNFIINALKQIVENKDEWSKDYHYSSHTNEFYHKNVKPKEPADYLDWFKL